MKKMNKIKILKSCFLIFLLALFQTTCLKNKEIRGNNDLLYDSPASKEEKSKYPCSEVIQFLSMGFNTEKKENYSDTYYFYGYEDYSEAILLYSDCMLPTGTAGVFYPFSYRDLACPPLKYIRYNGQNDSIGYYYNMRPYYVNNDAYEYKFKNDKLVYYANYHITKEGEFVLMYVSDRIEQDTQGLRIYLRNRKGDESSLVSYYNISRAELLDIFLKGYVQIIREINDKLNVKFNDKFQRKSNNADKFLLDFIRGRTPRELAIFRNCLYAIKGSKFADSTWEEFFNKYLEGYKAEYPENEVIEMFTDNEKWLLYLILRYENGRI
jgi:hypothetical protein